MAGKDNKKGGGGPGATASMCKYSGCKGSISKFGFCAEHFDQFKFGLITKNGEHVSDYDKKFDHFMRQQAKTKSA